MALTYYFAQHTSRRFTHTQKLWVEKNWTIKVYQELVLAYPHTHQCISSNAILISFFWNAKISNLTIFITRSSPRISNLIRHAFTKLRNFKGNFIRFKKALGTRKLFGVMEVLYINLDCSDSCMAVNYCQTKILNLKWRVLLHVKYISIKINLIKFRD